MKDVLSSQHPCGLKECCPAGNQGKTPASELPHGG